MTNVSIEKLQNALDNTLATMLRDGQPPVVKHTLGIWTAHRLDSGRYSIISRSEEQHICETVYDGDEHDANARLIAAAPKLLEALRDLQFAVQHLIGGMDADDLAAYDKARKAIAEAEGR